MSDFVVRVSGYEVDSDGYLIIEFGDYLEQVSQMEEQTYDIIEYITKEEDFEQLWVEAFEVYDVSLHEFTSDQVFTEALLQNNVTYIKVPLN